MKKLKYLFLVCCMAFLLTGCVKYNATMDIKEDKSMEFSIVYALDTSMFGNKKILSDDDIKKLEDQGFKVKDYSKDKMVGFTISKTIKNIDDVSSTEDIKYSLSGILEDSSEKIFKVKKGFIKNKYTAKFDFSTSDSSLNNNSSDDEKETQYKDSETETKDNNKLTDSKDDDKLVDTKDDEKLVDTEEDDTDSIDINDDYSGSIANMDLSFNVTLPYAATDNNATKVEDGGKKLTWSLVSDKANNIEFSFELYNISFLAGSGRIILFVVIGVLVFVFICILLGFIFSRGKKNKNPYPTISSVKAEREAKMTENTTPVEEVKPVEEPKEEQPVEEKTEVEEEKKEDKE